MTRRQRILGVFVGWTTLATMGSIAETVSLDQRHCTEQRLAELRSDALRTTTHLVRESAPLSNASIGDYPSRLPSGMSESSLEADDRVPDATWCNRRLRP